MEEAYILEMNNIVKEFSSHRVLNNVSLHVKKGEVHALCGENGAGKSTLMKILSGAYPYGQYEGDILIDGKLQKFHNTKESAEAGVEIIYQELEIVPNMTVAENIFIGKEKEFYRGGLLSVKKMQRSAQEILNSLGMEHISAARLCGSLSFEDRKLIEIARAMYAKPKILIIDDDRDITQIIRILLEGEGFETCTAYSGAQALASLDETGVRRAHRAPGRPLYRPAGKGRL